MSGFFELRATDDPDRWVLPVTRKISLGRVEHAYMFGGVGLAAGIAAMERACGRPVLWATAQYLSYAMNGMLLDLSVRRMAVGRQITHARVAGHVGNEEILTVSAALGDRPAEFGGQWAEAPEVAPPEECPESKVRPGDLGGVHDRIEVRVAVGSHRGQNAAEGPTADGRVVVWIRPRGDYPIDAPMLAVMADYMPGAIGNALGMATYGTSLDNTVRYGDVRPTDWVKCEIRIPLVERGVAHGSMNMFSQDGRLMAIASQSVIVRDRLR